MWNEDQQQHFSALHRNLPAGLCSSWLRGRSQIVPCVLYIWPKSAGCQKAACSMLVHPQWIHEYTDSLTSLSLALSHKHMSVWAVCPSRFPPALSLFSPPDTMDVKSSTPAQAQAQKEVHLWFGMLVTPRCGFWLKLFLRIPVNDR